MATLSRLSGAAVPKSLARAVLVAFAVLVTVSGMTLTAPTIYASAMLPGYKAWDPTSYRTPSVYSPEYRKAKSIANRSSTWQTIYTWPQGRFAKMTTHRYSYIDGAWRISGDVYRQVGLFNVWWIQCEVIYRFNGSAVWTDQSTSCSYSAIGMSMAKTERLWNDGGGNGYGFLIYGADWTLRFDLAGIVMTAGHYFRRPVYCNGTVGDVSWA